MSPNPGEVRWVRTDKIPFRNEGGQAVGIVVIATDITEAVTSAERVALQA